MGIFGGVPSGRGGPGTSRRDRRQSGVRARSKAAARRETERHAQIFILFGLILTALVVLVVAGYGYYQTTVAPKHQTVLKVGKRKFDMGYVEKRLAYEMRRGSAASLAASGAQYAVVQAINTIQSDEIVRLNAAQQNVSVSEDEIDAEIRRQLAISDTADPATYADAYRNEVRDSGLSAKEYREIVAVGLLEQKIRWIIAGSIPANADQVRLFDIQAATQEEAQKVIDRLNAGEDFSAIAQELSLDLDTKDKGGEAGWMPRAALETSVADPIFALEAGQWTQPLESSTGGYFVYKVADKATAMTVTPEQQKTVEDQTYSNQENQVIGQTTIEQPYITDEGIFTDLVQVAIKNGAAIPQQQ